ncbi:MAG: selenocysteine lyase/cysteine desulfurase [Sphingobacteriales bacterium]|jgi:selenocysteine lyase/cysteine desulfurase
MSNRRDFFKNLTALAGVSSFMAFADEVSARELESVSKMLASDRPEETAKDENFWGWVRESYTVSANIINLNNGNVSPQPKTVQETHDHYMRLSNEAPSYYMRRIVDQGRETVRAKLAQHAGVSPEEIAINRNTTEALNTIIFGIPMTAGDEVVLSPQDYPNMLNAWRQREKRDGIVLKWVTIDLPLESEEEIIKAYTNAITSRTKLVMITHMIHHTGQILPVRKIADVARSKGAEVMVDGAHTFGHLVYSIPDLGADYFGTSLHKWMCCPFGTGFLWIKKEKISKIWPLLSAPEPASDDIRKFEHLGTRSVPKEMSISRALDFHDIIGAERKQARLQYLKSYWYEGVREVHGAKFRVKQDLKNSCALGSLEIEGASARDLASHLYRNYKVHVIGLENEFLNAIRVTPHVYSNLKDLDRLVKGVRSFNTK